MSNYIIIGAGATGLSAAETIRTHHPHATITLMTDEVHGYYSRPGIAYLLTRELPERQLYPRSETELDRLGLELVTARVTRLEPEVRCVLLENGQRWSYDALLLATGAAAVRPALPGINLPGVVTLDGLDDARQILQMARAAKRAVVVGGGITALELVEGLRAQKIRVHYFLRRDRFWNSVLDPAESQIVESRLMHEGVQIHRHTEIKQVLAKKDWRGRPHVAGVETTSGDVIDCQMVAVAIGVRPRLDLVAGTGIPTDRGILVNPYLQTGVEGIYAAGDVAQVLDPGTGKAYLDSLWPVAVAQGRAAGANMTGVLTPFVRRVPLNATRLANLIVTFVGAVGQPREVDADLVTISRGDSELWRGIPDVLVVQDQHELDRQRLMIKDNRLVGATLMGDQALSPVVQHLIENQVDLGPILPALQNHRVPITDLLLRLYKNPSSRAVQQPQRRPRTARVGNPA